MALAAGKLDRRITIQRATVADDGFQSTPSGWSDLATVWASKDEISDGERGQAQGAAATATTRFQIRWSSTVADVGPKDRATCEGRTYDILGVKEIGRREGLEITASRRADV